MSKIKDLLFEINHMKRFAKDTAKNVRFDITEFGTTDRDSMQEAVYARFLLDQLLLDEQSLIEKWSQFKVYDSITDFIKFKGTKQECIDWVSENDFIGTYVIIDVLPSDNDFDWDEYFEKIRKRSVLSSL